MNPILISRSMKRCSVSIDEGMLLLDTNSARRQAVQQRHHRLLVRDGDIQAPQIAAANPLHQLAQSRHGHPAVLETLLAYNAADVLALPVLLAHAINELVGKTPHQITALRVGRTFQNIRLFRDLSVLDNVRIAHYAQVRYSPLEALLHLGRYRREEERIIENSRRLLSIFKLEHLAGETAKNLPYGSQRRLEIARALAIDPELLLLDEPAAGMNPNEIDQLMEFIQWIRREFQLTILLIEHQMKLVMGICERIKVLDFGETLAEGPPEAIQNDPKVLEAYLGEGPVG